MTVEAALEVPPSGSPLTRVVWRVRSQLSPERRARLRRATDPLVGPVGSIRGAHTTTSVALTFDDGPGDQTGSILDVLDAHGATATFFVLVDHAEARPELVRRIAAAGHEVGLHGLDHRRLTTMAPAVVRGHIAEGRQRLEAVLGGRVRLFRPPFGSQSPRTFAAARRCGLQVVVWTADADDWIDHDPSVIADLAVERAEPGGILLLHDGFSSDPASPLPEPGFDRAHALDLLLAGLAERRLEPVSVGRLLAAGRTRRTAWFRP